jgi:hypothetical protein
MRFFRAFIPALLVLAMLAVPTAPSKASVSIGISVGIAPPVLPIYEQPPIPGPGYIWTPGYWAWGPYGYYWVPGTWVYPPIVGVLWTPPWWGWFNGVYLFHAGYWGPTVGFYGGINYGFGYVGVGYEGGYWQGGQFFYNRTVNNINVTNINITNVYNKTVVSGVDPAMSRVSFNGGKGGITTQPTAQQQATLQEHHIQPTSAQLQHFNAARTNTALLAKNNNGQPTITTTSQAGRFNNTGTVTGGTSPHFQSNVRTTSTGPTGPTGTQGGAGTGGSKNFKTTTTGPTGATGVQGGGTGGSKNFRPTTTGPTGPTGSQGGGTGKNYHTTNTGPTGPTGPKGGGPKTLQGGPGGHPVTTQTVHPTGGQPKGQPKGQPQGKDQKQHQPG